jgi:hypothetical protein
MGRDAGGHGHNEGEAGNPNHGKNGEFSSGGGGSGGGGKSGSSAHPNAGNRVAFGLRKKMQAAAAKGDHQKAQTHDGHGSPITMHAGRKSVGVGSSSGGGGGSSGGSSGSSRGGSAKPTKATTGLRKAAQERVAIGKATDQRHFPSGKEAQTIAHGRIANVPQSKRGMSGARRGI